MASGDVFFPWHGDAAAMDGAIQLAEGGTLGQIDEFVVVTESGEKTISLAQAKVRLQAAKEIAPAKQTVDGLRRGTSQAQVEL